MTKIKSNTSKVLTNGAWYFLVSGMSHLYLLLSIPILTKGLSVKEWGFYTILVQIGTMVQVLGATAFSQGVFRFYASEKKEKKAHLVWTSITGLAVCQGLLLGGIWCSRDFSLPLMFANIDLPIDPVFGWACLWWYFASLRGLLMTLVKIQELPFRVFGLTGLYGVLVLPCIAISVLWLDAGLTGVAIAFALAEMAVSLINLVMVIREHRLSFSLDILRRSLSFSMPIVPGAVCTSLLMNSDRMVLSRFVDLEQQGIYGLGAMIGSGMALIVTSYWSSYVPRQLALQAKDGIQKSAIAGRNIIKSGYFFITISLLMLCLFAWPFFRYPLHRIDDAAIMALVTIGIGCGYFFRFLLLQPLQYLYFVNKSFSFSFVNFFFLIIVIITSWLFFMIFGLAGPAFSMAFSSAILFLPALMYSNQYYPTSFPKDCALQSIVVVVLVASSCSAAPWVTEVEKLIIYSVVLMIIGLYLVNIYKNYHT